MIEFLLACSIATSTPQLPTAKQDYYLTQLANCESSGNSKLKIIDSNGYYSRGAFQFQMGTWKEQNEKYHLDYKEDDIFDYQKQKYLTHLMLLDGGARHWKTCTDDLGKYPK